MKLSELWLREWANPALDSKQLTNQLTMAGLEVDAVEPVAGIFNGVIVAEVLATTPHPQADRLTICSVDTGSGSPLQIVCGASNVRSGLKVALAMIGATLPNDFVIKETKLRGELSQGMLCSLSELGMADESEGIMELDEAAPVGENLREWLQLDDQIIEVDLTPNRADCYSVLGIAREVAALNSIPLKSLSDAKILPDIDDQLKVSIQNPEACSRYSGRVVKGINSSATVPVWMAERLRRSGVRSIHPVVDICNYVMLETGQPMHAFDLASLTGDIEVRTARENESLTLLDGQKITLSGSELLIADREKALALAGIMGGLESSVSEKTIDVFLESAFFNPLSMANIARSHGLSTDASQRFERGVDPAMPLVALERASSLIRDITGGKMGPVVEIQQPSFFSESISIEFNTAKVKHLTGVDIQPSLIRPILESLGMNITPKSDTILLVKPPSWRFDIQESVDLVEEIIRIYGYDRMEPQITYGTVQAGIHNDNEITIQRLSQWFSTRGYHETINYSFVNPELQQELYPDTKALELLNPLSSEMSQMRTGLWPGLIASMIYNLHRQQSTVRIFETGVIFDNTGDSLTERPCIAGLTIGEKGSLNWCEKPAPFDFFDVKGDLEALFGNLKLESIRFNQLHHPALHPGQSASIYMNDESIGWIGVLHPRIASAIDLENSTIILFELALKPLIKKEQVISRSVSRYPQIRRDLSFFIDADIEVSAIELLVRKVTNPVWLKAFEIFDVYVGPGVPAGKKSIAMALILQNPDKTLVDAEINSEIDAIIKILIGEFSIILRE